MKPQNGTKITYTKEGADAMGKKPHAIAGIVDSVDGNFCLFMRADNGEIDRFIYKFKNGLNRYFNWEGRRMFCLTVRWLNLPTLHDRAGEVYDRKAFDFIEDRTAYLEINAQFYPHMTEIETFEEY